LRSVLARSHTAKTRGVKSSAMRQLDVDAEFD